MSFKPCELVTYKDFHARMRGRMPVMIVIEKVYRIRQEGAYYRVVDDGEVVLLHSSQLRRLEKDEDSY